MLDTYDGWQGAIATKAMNSDHDGNQIVGLALDEPEATAMQNCFANAFGITTTRTPESAYLVIRACKKLNLANLIRARSMLYGVHYGRDSKP